MTRNNTKHDQYAKIRKTPLNHKPYTKTLMIFFQLQKNLSVTPKSFVVKYQADVSRMMDVRVSSLEISVIRLHCEVKSTKRRENRSCTAVNT